MSDRVSRLEQKVDQLTTLLTGLAKDLQQIKGQKSEKAPEIQPQATPSLYEPEEPYGLYCRLFDDWIRGDDATVIKQLKGMTLEQLRQLVEAAKMPVQEKTDKTRILLEMKTAFEEASVKARAVQFSGLYCLLESEWHACNYPFVEGRLGELNIETLRGLAAGNNITIGHNARRASIVKAILKALEARRSKEPPPAGPKRAHNPQVEHYQYIHSALFSEWSRGNREYVVNQLSNLTPERLHAFIKANNLPVKEKSNRPKIIKELSVIYGSLENTAQNEQHVGLQILLAHEWQCGNRVFVNRRLHEMTPEKLAAFAEANAIKTGGKSGKTALIKVIKAHLEEQAKK